MKENTQPAPGVEAPPLAAPARVAVPVTLDQLVDRALQLALSGRRTILGIAGAPGAGKSTLAEALVKRLGPVLAVFVPMDGFHLSNTVLDSLGLRASKGAQNTFDAHGYVHLLQRLAQQPESAAAGLDGIIYAPEFDRALDSSIGSAVPVQATTPLVVTEGNYLLLDDAPWNVASQVCAELWFLAPDEDERVSQLTARHERFGRSAEEARQRSLGSDQHNAEMINATAHRATHVFRLTDRW
ncbi:nucleoside/nucleotide kinase family protein [Galactobacter caseinivorans]|uniref:Nucleoside/nucleotide kinase family protein n=1 Tax=Galactobacter caseinivorans TaxID=2676123 RepID=A0A496PLP6_9MICC|nr:nucleoside/nucleotide kinase family protein [Galactobacter caseinivorans]RKW71386.1 nucleoside/nucleotide kinase family protein [Galactobacter caseinivorans]